MLLGRSRELSRIGELLRAASRGESAALVVRGEAGIGKSALVEAVARAAADGGAVDRPAGATVVPRAAVLRTRGIEAETAIPFGGLADLLRPALPLLGELPGPQSDALAGALALGPPAAADRFAIAAATLSLLALAGRGEPLLCVVDDAHWLDPASAEALVFAARRMHAEGSVILFTVRDGEPGAERFLALDPLPLGGLDAEAAGALLADGFAEPPPHEVVDRLVADTGGNPLALQELPGLLSADQLAGQAPILAPLPVGSLLQQSFLRRVERLPGPARDALLLAATSDVDTVDVLDRALRDADRSLADLEPAEEAGLLALDGGKLRFHHPLVRSAVYHSGSPAERRAAHRRLGDAFAHVADPQADERRVWHLAAATLTTDETVAAALEQVGLAAARAQGHAAAARALERAAELSPERGERARRLMAAARAAVPAGATQDAIRLLEQAQRWSDDPALAARAESERLRLGVWGIDAEVNRARLFDFAARAEATMPAVAVHAYLAAAQASLFSYDVAAITRATGRAALLGGADERVGLLCDVLAAMAAAQAGETARAAKLMAARHEQLLAQPTLDIEQLVTVSGVCYLALEQPEKARPLLGRAVESSRRANTAGLLAVQLPWMAALEWQSGNWTIALALAEEAVRLAPETGWLAQLPNSLSTMARVEAGMGLPGCRTHAEQAIDAARRSGSTGTLVHGLAARGLLELGLGDHAAAADDLTAALAAAPPTAAPLLRFHVLPDLVEACILAGRGDRARVALAELDELAERCGRVSALAAAARCHALLDRDTATDRFEQALALHARGTPPFDTARTRLVYGARLRRGRDRAGARAQLGAALEAFERLGATPWAERARHELTTSGGSAPAHGEPVERLLTAQELQVALAVRGGMSNAEAATSLFLSVKTIEYHLSAIYRKLGIRGRTQLARFISPAPPTTG
ncbi:helix-turn-helix transcriptional regulator [Pseudonocardia humida]|uniref:AAA family ATPase n=1 Tax=Pseudonocardia humida TaxID=2800819 RepID=A0ABT1A5Y1_9PSEU|nr:LuxR family transcriptional regulator [Pseudonocardia humida]MCO1658418.1 AAA family ATPase [Pseudonocardia humida]